MSWLRAVTVWMPLIYPNQVLQRINGLPDVAAYDGSVLGLMWLMRRVPRRKRRLGLLSWVGAVRST
jgi:hypothetical protein